MVKKYCGTARDQIDIIVRVLDGARPGSLQREDGSLLLVSEEIEAIEGALDVLWRESNDLENSLQRLTETREATARKARADTMDLR